MKTFLAIADVHLKVHKDAPVSWSVSRYREFFKYIVEQCKEKSAGLWILGDLCDTAKPSLVELELLLEFFHLLEREKIYTTLIGGNHEVCESNNTSIYDYLKLETFGPRLGHSYINYALNEYHVYDDKFSTLSVSHHKLKDFAKVDYDTKNMLPTIFLGHIRGNVGKYVKEEFPLSQLSNKFNAVFLGDIHSDIEIDGCVYCNVPINSQYEVQPNCSYLEITVDGSKVNWKRIYTDFPSLIQANTTAKDFHKLNFDERHFYRCNVSGTREALKLVPKFLHNVKIEAEIEGVEMADVLEHEVEQKVYSTLDEEMFEFVSSVVVESELLVPLVEEWRSC